MTIVLRATEDQNRTITATHQGPGAEKIVDLFGTDTIPTAFSFRGVEDVDAKMREVQEFIQQHNPADNVVWDYASVRYVYPASQEVR